MTTHCGNLHPHDPHQWTARTGSPTAATHHCTGHIVTAYAERRWADDQDAEDAADDLRRAEERELGEWAREGWAS